ncbi:MAG: hypothetical protein JWO03_918 [Bacteroidetes bacterium]|nr:hypothetical protein [Bacteroidota bacterium]
MAKKSITQQIKEAAEAHGLAVDDVFYVGGWPTTWHLYIDEDVTAMIDCDNPIEATSLERMTEKIKAVRFDKQQACRVCGCTQNNACPGGCWWTEEDLCSSCDPKKSSALDYLLNK